MTNSLTTANDITSVTAINGNLPVEGVWRSPGNPTVWSNILPAQGPDTVADLQAVIDNPESSEADKQAAQELLNEIKGKE